MIRTKGFFVDFDRLSIERVGLGILALVVKQKGKIVVLPRNVGMILDESLFIDLDRPPQERISFRILTLLGKKLGKIAE